MGSAVLLYYIGANIGYRAIRYDLECRDAVVIEIRRKVYNTLDVIRKGAMMGISIELEKHELIKYERECEDQPRLPAYLP